MISGFNDYMLMNGNTNITINHIFSYLKLYNLPEAATNSHPRNFNSHYNRAKFCGI